MYVVMQKIIILKSKPTGSHKGNSVIAMEMGGRSHCKRLRD